MSDIIERAEAELMAYGYVPGPLATDLVAALKAARAENERLGTLWKNTVGPKDYWGNPA
jgi:hypothetical protein